MRAEHLVLRNKFSGKIASRNDHLKLAMTLEACRLEELKMGGGIVSLLLPRTLEQKKVVYKVSKNFAPDRVFARSGVKKINSDKLNFTKAIKDDNFWTNLAAAYGSKIGNKHGPQRITAKAFTQWLKKELKNKCGLVYKLTKISYPVLLDVSRADRWWADAISQRRKRRVKD